MHYAPWGSQMKMITIRIYIRWCSATDGAVHQGGRCPPPLVGAYKHAAGGQNYGRENAHNAPLHNFHSSNPYSTGYYGKCVFAVGFALLTRCHNGATMQG